MPVTLRRSAMPRALRRLSLPLLLLGLSGCVSIPEPASDTTAPDAQALFDATTQAHGREAFDSLQDIAVAYDGEWYRLIQRLQAALVDPEYRKSSEERILLGGAGDNASANGGQGANGAGPATGLVAQVHTGPAGEKVVLRQRRWQLAPGPDARPNARPTPRSNASSDAPTEAARQVSVSYDGEIDEGEVVLDAAALVADAYRMFLLGPLHFIGSDRQMETLSPQRLNGRRVDRLRIRTRPGLGAAAQDDYVLYIDREERLTRRIRFSLAGLASTRGAIVETDYFDFIERDGLVVATRFFEQVRRPIPGLDAHRWRMTGLDLNRGMTAADFDPTGFSGAAAAPAQPLDPSQPPFSE